MKLGNYVLGSWTEGEGEGKPLFNAVNGEIVAYATTKGLDFEQILEYGRQTGSKALRKMTFYERGMMLKKLALHLIKKKAYFYEVSYKTGATKVDSWIDIEGGFGNLFANASLRRSFPNQTFHVDGDAIDISRGGQFMAHHIMVPKRGVAVHINAFNFPVWGMLEKCACNWMAGVAAVVKPATATSYLTEVVVKEIIASGILPEGALQLVCGSARTIIDHVDFQDVVTFTGSADVGRMLKGHQRIINNAVPFNMEADSLNAIVLGQDATPDTPEFNIFIKEVAKEMTVKCGQKCTAIRRIIVPEKLLDEVQKSLSKRLGETTIGNPSVKGVRMGALASKDQVKEVQERVAQLAKTASVVYGGEGFIPELIEADYKQGAFLAPTLLLETQPFINTDVHEVEAFGPVSTIMPYKDLEEAIELAHLGKGSLVCSIVTFDDTIAREFVVEAASHHGRILVLNRENAKLSTGHGSPLPTLVHGGPGRAGGGEEMGGMRGVKHYLQRCAVQGTPTTITKVTGIYQPNAKVIEAEKHPFKYHFEEIETGMSLKTHKRTVTDSDIQNFANLTWDVFYAHTDITSLDGTIFEKRAAHGYFLLAMAAGLFVSPAKGPVGANYGLETCRFIRPIYHNDTLQVRLTCQEKIDRDTKGKDHPAGVVKWYAEIFDQDEELVAMATVLTLVKKKSPFAAFSTKIAANQLLGLTESAKPAWGTMTAQHMVEHLELTALFALGKKEQEAAHSPEVTEKYTESLYNYRAFPKNFKASYMPEGLDDLRYENLEAAKAGLVENFKAVDAFFKENPSSTVYNPVFGPLNRYEFQLLNQKHFQHHFQQFNLLT